MKTPSFQGIIFDIAAEIVIEYYPVVRGSYAEAIADAKSMVKVINDHATAAEAAADNEYDYDAHVGRVDEVDCYVLVDGALVHSEAEVYHQPTGD